MSVVPIRPAMLGLLLDDPAAAGEPVPFQPRAYPLAYYPGEVNRCPGCGRSHWWVRNATAECAFCNTALPLAG